METKDLNEIIKILSNWQTSIEEQKNAEEKNQQQSKFVKDKDGPYVFDTIKKARERILTRVAKDKKVNPNEHSLFVESLDVLYDPIQTKQYLKLINDPSQKYDIVNYEGFSSSEEDVLDIVDTQVDRQFPFMQVFQNCSNINEVDLVSILVKNYGAENVLKEMQDFAKWLKEQNLEAQVDLHKLANLVKNCEKIIQTGKQV